MRRINKIIIHCSATKANHDITVRDIKRWHLANGWNDTGYHYFIRLDGTIEDGRPIEKAGAHTKGHNGDSIGICYAGGVAENGTPLDTRTPKQKNALRALVELIKESEPHATVHGHNEFSNKACPSFNVKTEL